MAVSDRPDHWDEGMVEISHITNVDLVDVIDLINTINTINTIAVIASIINVDSVDLIDRISLIDAITKVGTVTSVGTIDELKLIDSIASIDSLTSVGTIGELKLIDSIASIDSLTSVGTVDLITLIGEVTKIAGIDLITRITEITRIKELPALDVLSAPVITTKPDLGAVGSTFNHYFVHSVVHGDVVVSGLTPGDKCQRLYITIKNMYSVSEWHTISDTQESYQQIDSTTEFWANKFTLTSKHDGGFQAQIYVKKTGTPTGGVNLEVWTSSAGKPASKLYGPVNIPDADIGTSFAWKTANFGSVVLDPGDYWIVAKNTTGVDAFNYYTWGLEFDASYVNVMAQSVDSGSSWTLYNGMCFNLKLMYAEYHTPNYYGMTVAGVSVPASGIVDKSYTAGSEPIVDSAGKLTFTVTVTTDYTSYDDTGYVTMYLVAAVNWPVQHRGNISNELVKAAVNTTSTTVTFSQAVQSAIVRNTGSYDVYLSSTSPATTDHWLLEPDEVVVLPFKFTALYAIASGGAGEIRMWGDY